MALFFLSVLSFSTSPALTKNRRGICEKGHWRERSAQGPKPVPVWTASPCKVNVCWQGSDSGIQGRDEEGGRSHSSSKGCVPLGPEEHLVFLSVEDHPKHASPAPTCLLLRGATSWPSPVRATKFLSIEYKYKKQSGLCSLQSF